MKQTSTVKVDASRNEINGQFSKLPPRQFNTLVALAKAAGKVLSRNQILAAVFPEDADQIDPRIVDAWVCRVRRELGNNHILTVTKRGYRANGTVSVVA